MLAKLRSAISEQASSYLSRVKSLENVVELLSASTQPRSPHTQQAIAYALARLGNFVEARGALVELVSQLNNESSWQREISERAKGLLIQLENDPAAAQKQLEMWEAESTEALRLGKVCS